MSNVETFNTISESFEPISETFPRRLKRSPRVFILFPRLFNEHICFFSLKMQMLNQLKNCLKTPEEARYLAKVTKHDHFDDLSDIDNALASVPE